MSQFENRRDRREREVFAPIEAMIHSAGNYIRPSENLRPSTLEAARRQRSNHRWNFRLASAACLVVLLGVANIPGRFATSPAHQTTADATVAEEYALRSEAAKNLGFTFSPPWAWYEAFLELRNKQSKMIND